MPSIDVFRCYYPNRYSCLLCWARCWHRAKGVYMVFTFLLKYPPRHPSGKAMDVKASLPVCGSGGILTAQHYAGDLLGLFFPFSRYTCDGGSGPLGYDSQRTY